MKKACSMMSKQKSKIRNCIPVDLYSAFYSKSAPHQAISCKTQQCLRKRRHTELLFGKMYKILTYPIERHNILYRFQYTLIEISSLRTSVSIPSIHVRTFFDAIYAYFVGITSMLKLKGIRVWTT